jgi:hypothetical protein
MRWGRREYRAKAFDCLSRAQSIDDPEQRADMLGLARMWMSLSEPLGDIPGAYEYPSQDQRPRPAISWETEELRVKALEKLAHFRNEFAQYEPEVLSLRSSA